MGDFEYFYSQGEANFGPPIEREVAGGAHLTFDVMMFSQATIYMLRRPDGLHDGPKNALYFPHGLIRFGETVDECVGRLVMEQAGAEVRRTHLYTMSSWVEDRHWHLCLNVLAEIESPPRPGDEVSEVVVVDRDHVPSDFAWWTPDQAREVLTYLERLKTFAP